MVKIFKISMISFLLYFIGTKVYSQPIAVDTTFHAIYKGEYFYDTPYSFRADEDIDYYIRNLSRRLRMTNRFTIISCSIEGVAVLREAKNYTFLYNRVELKKLREQKPLLADLMILYALGHIDRNHELNTSFRIREESAAFEFVGRALYRLGKVVDVQEAAEIMMADEYSYNNSLPLLIRQQQLIRGWNAEDGILRSKENLGFLEDAQNLNDLPLPMFYRMGCPQYYDLPIAYFDNCNTLSAVELQLKGAMRQLGYSQLSYYATPGGFVMLSPVEQITDEGFPLAGQERWQDYPTGASFDNILDYLSALVLPRKGYFRLFAFVVANQQMQQKGGAVTGQVARSWLKSGGFWLPESIGSQELDQHHITVLLYEFEAPESTKKMSERCTSRLISIQQHLMNAGIKKQLEKK